MINLKEVGAFGTVDNAGNLSVQFGIYLPGIRAIDGFEIIVRVIHRDDRFNPDIQPQDFSLSWIKNNPLDLWSATVSILPHANSHFGQEGYYLYRYQLWWTPQGGSKQLVTRWFTDPFARLTDVGELSAVLISRSQSTFNWTDSNYKTPELDDLVVYELQVEEFNDTFNGIVDRLDYLKSLGVNCLELMPVTSVKVDFDWGYGPLHYFAPNARFGGSDGLKQLVNSCHAAEMAVILDVVYQHVDPTFTYKLVYDDVNNIAAAPTIISPMIAGHGMFGPQCDFSQPFTQDYFLVANRSWLDEYHVDGFRYDEVTDLYSGPMDTAYAKLAYDTYQYSLGISRFKKDENSYSRIVQCAEALWKARDVLRNTYSNCAWQDDLMSKSQYMISNNYVDADFAHLLDPNFGGYPSNKMVNNAKGELVEMPVAPFQYLETHDHAQLIVFAGTEGGASAGSSNEYALPICPGDRSQFYKLQPYAIALYTSQGIPMLWQGQEFADNYNLPKDEYEFPGNTKVKVSSSLKIGLRRDTHWEFFYDDYGVPMMRLYRRLGWLRRTYRALRSRDSYFYYIQSLQNNKIIAYHRHAQASQAQKEEYVMVALNFADSDGTISLPFPKAGIWKEMLDNTSEFVVAKDGDIHKITISSNYGAVFVWSM